MTVVLQVNGRTRGVVQIPRQRLAELAEGSEAYNLALRDATLETPLAQRVLKTPASLGRVIVISPSVSRREQQAVVNFISGQSEN